ncbi:MAG: exodeoxyribonuclease VII small subunit [Saprospiraceae bacterium]|nr:exodeoxyribonuclease VII small subunit [Saprospiraceae bacterium]
MKKEKLAYETALDELKSILEKTQNDEYSMEELSIAIERATQLLKFCEQSLRALQDKIIEIK